MTKLFDQSATLRAREFIVPDSGKYLVQPFRRKKVLSVCSAHQEESPMRIHIKALAFGSAALVVAPNAAVAAVATGTLNVTMTIQAACSVASTADVAFGTHGTLTSNSDATGSIVILCTNSTPYTVALDAGAGTGATTTVRKMTASGATIQYALYRDSSRTQLWGTTQGTDTAAGTGNGSNQTLTVYGRVPSQATPAPGSYTDTVNITVTY